MLRDSNARIMKTYYVGFFSHRLPAQSPIQECLRMGRLATQTESLQLATGVTHTVTRHPAVLANSWARVQKFRWPGRWSKGTK